MTTTCRIRARWLIVAIALGGVVALDAQRGRGGSAPQNTTGESVTLKRKDATLTLTRSTRYRAFKTTDRPNFTPFFQRAESQPNARLMTTSPVLARRHLAIISESAFRGDPSFESLAVTADWKAAPVFSLGGIDLIATDELLVRFASATPPEARAQLAQSIGARIVGQSERGPFQLRLDPARSPVDAANTLNLDARVEYAEPDFVLIFPPHPRILPGSSPAGASSATAAFPSDPLYRSQWSLASRARNGTAHIQIEPAWKDVPSASKVIVAVLDEGVDSRHPDLKDKIKDPIDETADPIVHKADPFDWDGHGTACAGIVGAGTNNGEGIAAVGKDVMLMPVRIASTEKPKDPLQPGPWVTTMSAIANGIRYAVDHGAAVLNNSWNGGARPPGLSADIENAITYAATKGRNGKGAVVVFSAGNTSGSVMWPATLSSSLPIIAVAATNEWDEIKTRDSKDGEKHWSSASGKEVTIAAPGVHILTTDNSGSAGYSPDDYTPNFNGTSSAAPHVAGVAALLIAKHPDWTAAKIRDQLVSTADKLKLASGQAAPFGRLNACRALGLSSC